MTRQRPRPEGNPAAHRPTGLSTDGTVTVATAATMLDRDEDGIRLLIAYGTLTVCGHAPPRSETPNMPLIPLQQVLDYRSRIKPAAQRGTR